MNILNYPKSIHNWILKEKDRNGEAYEHLKFIDYLETYCFKYSTIPASTYTTSILQKLKNKALGVRKGVPDILIIVENHIVFVEMKRQKGSVTSQEQKDWIEAINKCNGSEAKICYGCEEAINYIESIKL